MVVLSTGTLQEVTLPILYSKTTRLNTERLYVVKQALQVVSVTTTLSSPTMHTYLVPLWPGWVQKE